MATHISLFSSDQESFNFESRLVLALSGGIAILNRTNELIQIVINQVSSAPELQFRALQNFYTDSQQWKFKETLYKKCLVSRVIEHSM